jgi:hypothetical protein
MLRVTALARRGPGDGAEQLSVLDDPRIAGVLDHGQRQPGLVGAEGRPHCLVCALPDPFEHRAGIVFDVAVPACTRDG